MMDLEKMTNVMMTIKPMIILKSVAAPWLDENKTTNIRCGDLDSVGNGDDTADNDYRKKWLKQMVV